MSLDLSLASQLVREAREDKLRLHRRPSELRHALASQLEAACAEVERLRRGEESWNKEAERHEADHRAHYEERELLRADRDRLAAEVLLDLCCREWPKTETAMRMRLDSVRDEAKRMREVVADLERESPR